MAGISRKAKRRLRRLAHPAMWLLALRSAGTVLRLLGLREATPLGCVTARWEQGAPRRTGRPLRPEDISLPRWVAGLPLFFYPLFPKTCLRRSLVLYRHLLSLGHYPRLVVGVRRGEEALGGHAWIELGGRVLGEPPEAIASFAPILTLSRDPDRPAQT